MHDKALCEYCGATATEQHPIWVNTRFGPTKGNRSLLTCDKIDCWAKGAHAAKAGLGQASPKRMKR